MDKDKIIRDLINKIDTLVGFLEENKLPDSEMRLGIIEEWNSDKEKLNQI